MTNEVINNDVVNEVVESAAAEVVAAPKSHDFGKGLACGAIGTLVVGVTVAVGKAVWTKLKDNKAAKAEAKADETPNAEVDGVIEGEIVE